MTDQQWNTLVSAIRGEALRPLPTAFIIDSPWLPNWAGHSILDYFTSDCIFLDDNLKAIEAFPETIFLPGFWSEFGMCTEPSAFGSVSIWGESVDFAVLGVEVREVRGHIESLRQQLLDPSQESLNGCLPSLEDSIRRMITIQEALRSIPAGNPAAELGPKKSAEFAVRGELSGLKREIRVAMRLIENGAAFCRDWAARFGAAEAGYIASGEAAPLGAAGTLECRG